MIRIHHWRESYFNKKNRSDRAYYKPLLGATITPSLMPLTLKKKFFSFEIAKNDICLGGCKLANASFVKKIYPKNTPLAPMSRIGPVRR